MKSLCRLLTTDLLIKSHTHSESERMDDPSSKSAIDVATSMMLYPISPMCSSDPSMVRTSCSSSSSPSSSLTSTSGPNHLPSSSHFVSEVEEELAAMLVVEQSYRVRHVACMRQARGTAAHQLPHEEWRRKICEWCYKVVDHFRHDREVVSVAMNYFDRFLVLDTQDLKAKNPGDCHCPTCKRSVDSRTFQLAAMTSLYLAIKLHGETGNSDQDCYYSSSSDSASHYSYSSAENQTKKRRKRLKLSSFVDLSRGQFSPHDLENMECTMLSTLSWKVNPTTPMALCTHLLRCMPHESIVPLYARHNYDLVLHVINELSRYMTELSVCLANVSAVYLPSQVAYASILISMDMLTHAALPLQVRDTFCDLVAHASFDCAVSLLPNDETICFLKERLRHCFLPEMLMDDADVEHQHPISIARDAGLLNMSYLPTNDNTANSQWDGKKMKKASSIHRDSIGDSPVCVSP